MKNMKASFNHLKRYYSEYNLKFLRDNYKQLSADYKVVDLGCGHMRNLRLFYDIGLKNLYGLDWQEPKPNFDYTKYGINFTKRDITKGLPYDDDFSDITLCNYVLMFIDKVDINNVLDEIVRISKRYIIIETYKLHSNIGNHQKKTDFKDYDFDDIYSYFSNKERIKILHYTKSEKIVMAKW